MEYPPPPYHQSPSAPSSIIVTQPTTVTIPLNARQWRSGLCGCLEDCSVCLPSTLVPTCYQCAIMKDFDESCCVAWPCFLGPLSSLIALRYKLRGKHNIEGTLMNDCLVSSCCYPCALCQLVRENKKMKFEPPIMVSRVNGTSQVVVVQCSVPQMSQPISQMSYPHPVPQMSPPVPQMSYPHPVPQMSPPAPQMVLSPPQMVLPPPQMVLPPPQMVLPPPQMVRPAPQMSQPVPQMSQPVPLMSPPPVQQAFQHSATASAPSALMTSCKPSWECTS